MKKITDIAKTTKVQWESLAGPIDDNFDELNNGKLSKAELAQTTGNSKTTAMSQDAVTKELTELGNEIKERSATKTVNANNGTRFFNISEYVGQIISVKVTGSFGQFGYYKSGSDYVVVGNTPDKWVSFTVEDGATDLFVYNFDAQGTTSPTMYLRTGLASEVAANKEKIDIISNKGLGYCYQGSLQINTVSHTFSTDYKFAGIGQKGFKMMKNEKDKKIIAATDGTYSGFWIAFLHWDTADIDIYMYSSIPADLKNMYIIATGIDWGKECVIFSTSNITPSVLGIKEKVNDLGLNSNATKTVNANNGTRFFNISEYVGQIISVKVTGSFGQFGYFKSGSQYVVVGNTPDKWVSFTVEDGATDLFVYNFDAQGTTSPTMYLRTGLASEVVAILPETRGCVIMSLGDSITTESYYMPKLRSLLQPSKYYNLAVPSATWADRTDTTSYDGNPLPIEQGDQSQNVLGNQVQKIINNPETYNIAPDIIIISASTNDAKPTEQDLEWNKIESFFTDGDETPIPCTSPTFDEEDTYKELRKTITGAMRYVCTRLQMLYPNSRIYILTPIQSCADNTRKYNSVTRLKQQLLTNVAQRMSLPVIHVGENCGINGDFEYGGFFWDSELATEKNPKNGRDLIDGLHPNNNGSWKMAKYIAKELMSTYLK